MFSLTGPGHKYEDVSDDLDEACQFGNSYVSAHFGSTYTCRSNTIPFYHFPIREKCKTYLNGDSIFDGRGIGFGKRIFNLGGESSVLLGFKPTRKPFQLNWPEAAGGTPWHGLPSPADPFSYFPPSSLVELKLHNLHSFKTDMYLSLILKN